MIEFACKVRSSQNLCGSCRSKGTYKSVYGTVEVKEEGQTLFLCRKTKHALVPMSETSFYQADDEDIEVYFENQNEQGHYTRLRVIQPFFWLTAERVER